MSPQRRTQRGLGTWLSLTVTPLFVLDHRRRVLFFNAGCEQLTGWAAGEVIGQVCDFVSNPDHTQVESLTGVLCPPPEVFDGVEQAVPAFVFHRTGERLSRLIRFFPLMGEDQRCDRVLGTISPLPQPSPGPAVTLDHQLHAELSALRSDLRRRYDITTLVGRSLRFQRLLQQVRLACRHSGSVHLQGEPGTGKEHLARLIHFQGETRRQAFIPIDCARLTRDELSNSVKRILRDSHDAEPTQLSPGTLYLRNVDRIPDSIQSLLLEHCREPIGTAWGDAAVDPHHGDDTDGSAQTLRLMSSSTSGLEPAIAADAISVDFADLLTAQQIIVPTLRDRPEDVPLLAQHFLESLNQDQESQISGFGEDVWKAFRKYSWPGNQEELRSVVAEARELCDQPSIRRQHLPFRFRTGSRAQTISPSKPVEIVPLEDRLADVEREHIQQALDQSRHNKSQAAQLLGITRARLYRRMQILRLAESGEPHSS